jgi:hypothetical protein
MMQIGRPSRSEQFTWLPAGPTVHWTHWPSPTSQATLSGSELQSASLVQGPQVPFGPQTGAVDGHWLLALHCTQVWLAEQCGAAGSEQSASTLHWTQVSLVGSQTGVAAGQLVASVEVQATQGCMPFKVVQIGVGGAQSPFDVHEAMHIPPVQIGALIGQSAEVRQATQVSVAVSQTGVAPVQAVVFCAVHWRHSPAKAPTLSQAASGATQSEGLATLQARQRRVPVSQTGWAGIGQSALLRQPMQVLVVVSQIRRGSTVQVELSTHGTHWPAFMPVVAQAGPPALPTQSVLFAQARQA